MIFSARLKGFGLSFLTALYSPYSVDKARTIATHHPATLNIYVRTLEKEESQLTSFRNLVVFTLFYYLH